ncbi:hypothetical protein M758_7G165700 [Ceratodon purpureus]|nr:hypothetical protein M758_7G165700 [Ceratodon purpureus]
MAVAFTAAISATTAGVPPSRKSSRAPLHKTAVFTPLSWLDRFGLFVSTSTFRTFTCANPCHCSPRPCFLTERSVSTLSFLLTEITNLNGALSRLQVRSAYLVEARSKSWSAVTVAFLLHRFGCGVVALLLLLPSVCRADEAAPSISITAASDAENSCDLRLQGSSSSSSFAIAGIVDRLVVLPVSLDMVGGSAALVVVGGSASLLLRLGCCCM